MLVGISNVINDSPIPSNLSTNKNEDSNGQFRRKDFGEGKILKIESTGGGIFWLLNLPVKDFFGLFHLRTTSRSQPKRQVDIKSRLAKINL